MERIESRIILLRGEKVLLDTDLAELYGVTTGVINQAMRRNADRFPADFVFQLTEAEVLALLRSQIVTSKAADELKPLVNKDILKSQSVISKDFSPGKGGRRSLPHAFTEQGVAMLSSVLRSPRAIAGNVGIMRAFVRLRQMIASHTDLARKLAALENKYDAQFKIVFDAIRELMTPPAPVKKREVGFHASIPQLRRRATTRRQPKSAIRNPKSKF